MLNTLLPAFATELRALYRSGPLTPQWWVDSASNQESVQHSTVWGALVRAVGRNYVPQVERSRGRSFKPDLTIVDRSGASIAVVEYESTNSSDGRVIVRDLPRFASAVQSSALSGTVLPAWWIIVTTLPDQHVQGLQYWGYNARAGFPRTRANIAARDRNPFQFYATSIQAAFATEWRRASQGLPGGSLPACHLVWVNLRPRELAILNQDGNPVASSLFPI